MSREEFEKWAQANGLLINKFNNQPDVYLMDETRDAEFAFQGGYDSRQPEIDKLQKDVETMEQAYLDEVATRIKAENEIDALRARVAELENGKTAYLVGLREGAKAAPAPMVPEVKSCKWTNHEADGSSDSWSGDCGIDFTLISDGPVENDMKFCPCCGGKITVAAPEVDRANS